jgi:ubiquinone/menaquinone biosynthesis C-methylase UbiE
MQGSANYNTVAFFYDRLCQTVFGQTIKKAQIESLAFIPPNADVLIAGGGTGWILEEIAKIHSSGLRITYIDSSFNMIQLSKKRNCALNTITFIQQSIENTDLPPHKFDVVITPFLFDNFSQSTAEFIFTKLDTCLKPNGYWLYIDFYLYPKSNILQKILLKWMYVFFRFTCKIEADKLPNMDNYFSSYKIKAAKNYFKDFITMQVFQKGVNSAAIKSATSI